MQNRRYVARLVMLVAAALLFGCTPGGKTVAPATLTNEGTEIGPFPLGVSVALKDYHLSLSKVSIKAANQESGLSTPNRRPGEKPNVARPGYRFVEAILTIVDDRIDPMTKRGSIPQSLYVFKSAYATADGSMIALSGGPIEWAVRQPQQVNQYMVFEVPADTRNLVAHVALSVETTEDLTFRLW